MRAGLVAALLLVTAIPAHAQCVAKVCTVTNEAGLVAAITYANATVGTAINLQSNITLTAELPALEAIDVILNGGNKTLDGDGSFRGLFVLSGLARIENLDIANAVAKGGVGNGGNVNGGGGGGGAGMGGGLFVTDGATVIVSNVAILDSNAYGGDGGERIDGGGGGGGLRGNGGDPGTAPTGGGGGGRLGDG